MMKPTVCILATCRNADLIRATTLVFDTIRVGFPTAEISAYMNAPNGAQLHFLHDAEEAAKNSGARIQRLWPTIHHEWIAQLIDSKEEPFWLCDTDVVFWTSMEQWNFEGQALAGRKIPEFYDEFTNCVTHARLHTSLLYIDPERVRERISAFKRAFPETPFNPMANLAFPLHVPPHDFYDTCCLLYRAIGGLPFNEAQLDCYDHINAGTIIDLVEHAHPGLRKRFEQACKDPSSLKGLWRIQNQFYDKMAR